jgi:hypothetical protein
MNEAAPAETRAAAEKKRPLLRRVPTSLVVTLLGIALSAWLLPAFTKQWSDRQKAHDLKAAIITDMASASARVLIGRDAVLSLPEPACASKGEPATTVTPTSNGPPAPISSAESRREHRCDRLIRLADQTRAQATAKIDRSWELANVQLEARLRAYVDPKVAADWQLYSWFIERFVSDNSVQALLDLYSASQATLEPRAARDAGAVIRLGQDIVYGSRFGISATAIDTYSAYISLKHKLRGYIPPPPHYIVGPGPDVNRGVRPMEGDLLAFEQEIAREVLNSHISGYSTSTHDLLNDLIP